MHIPLDKRMIVPPACKCSAFQAKDTWAGTRTGVVISMDCERSLPPKMYPASSLKPVPGWQARCH